MPTPSIRVSEPIDVEPCAGGVEMCLKSKRVESIYFVDLHFALGFHRKLGALLNDIQRRQKAVVSRIGATR